MIDSFSRCSASARSAPLLRASSAATLHRVLIATDLGEAIEGAPQVRDPLRARLRVEPPLDDLLVATIPRQPSRSPELDVGRANALVALVGHLGERGEGLVAPIELVGQDARELPREKGRLGLVALDLDALGEQLREPVPLLGLLAELARGARARRSRPGRRRERRRARGSSFAASPRALVEARETRADRRALGRIGHDRELALERVRRRGAVVARLLQIGDRLERQAARRVELREDPLVAGDRGLDVADGVGDELGLA